MKIENSNFHYAIDQKGRHELYITNGNIKLNGLSFEDVLGARLLQESGQNVFTVEPPKENPIAYKQYLNLVV